MSEDLQAQLMTRILREHATNPHPDMDEKRLRVHAAIHVVVETQLQRGSPPEVQSTLDRLMLEGLERHDAIHAIGSVASDEVLTCLSSDRTYDEQRYIERLRSLSAKSWLAAAEAKNRA